MPDMGRELPPGTQILGGYGSFKPMKEVIGNGRLGYACFYRDGSSVPLSFVERWKAVAFLYEYLENKLPYAVVVGQWQERAG